MPRISVVVPMYNVEAYLGACLESIAKQTFRDLEVVMVDDGSTDDSAAVARAFAEHDPRFRLVTQPNGGLSRARNTGVDAATGEFLAFLDSDDVLPRNAYELLLTALDETGSDFATGNVHRLIRGETVQAPFLARAFRRTELKTHVTRYKWLLADRTAWNKLWRRSFWDQHAFRFPERVVHEDIPVVLPAHFLARSVDVIADPVYFYRVRGEGELSITQRRLEPRVLLDRLAAIDHVREFIAEHGSRRARRWYDESIVRDDLRLHVNILDTADDAYRALFLDRVNALLDTASPRIFDDLPAIDRLKWHLVRQRLIPELIEVLRFEREDLAATPAVRIGRRWYGDYPYRTDERLRIPRSVYRLDQELVAAAQLDGLERVGDRLRITGQAYIDPIGAPGPGEQRVTVSLLRRGRFMRVRSRMTPLRLATRQVHRPDADSSTQDTSWGGFEATLDPRRLRTLGRRRPGTWELRVTVRAGAVTRRRSRFVVRSAQPIRAVELPVSDGVVVQAAVSGTSARVTVAKEWITVQAAQLDDDGTLVVSGEARLPARGRFALAAERRNDERTLTYELEPASRPPHAFLARVPLRELLDAPAPPDASSEDRLEWRLWAVAGDERLPVVLAEDAPLAGFRSSDREVTLFRGRGGQAGLAVQPSRPVLTEARWEHDAVVLRGELPDERACPSVLLVDADRGDEHVFAARTDAGARGFEAVLQPARVESLAGALPLTQGRWELRACLGAAPPAPVTVARELRDRMPLETVVDRKPFLLGTGRDDRAVLTVRPDLETDEKGRYQQRRLRECSYARRRSEPLLDAVVYSSYGGRQYSDSPRAIHEELVRRDAPLEHLWVVRDGMCQVPPSATPLRKHSREYHEALARARFVITNDHFPEWFERRPDQVCLQTWHGTPLKRLGLDVSNARKEVRRFQLRWERQLANWQYVVSPNRFSTPILRRAYAIEGDMLELGYPRVDLLVGADREEARRRLRRRLGVPDDARVVLYAPTYRDQVVDRRGRYRLDVRLDLERLHDALGDDTVVLFRKHHYVVGPVPTTGNGFVRDVSSYPDGTELLLIADVLVTDYSSMMVDFANSGLPMLFFTYDLDDYQERIRGFYLDFLDTVPGPLLRTSDEVADALRDLDGVQAEYAERYAAFRSRFCELDDGHAAVRVVDRVFGP